MVTSSKKVLINWIVAPSLAAAGFCVIYFSRGDYSWRGVSDAFFVFGVFELLIPVLILLGRTGIFDIFSYSFIRLGESFRHEQTKRWDTAYDYKEYKKDERGKKKPYLLPFLTMGGVLIFLAFIALIVFDKML